MYIQYRQASELQSLWQLGAERSPPRGRRTKVGGLSLGYIAFWLRGISLGRARGSAAFEDVGADVMGRREDGSNWMDG